MEKERIEQLKYQDLQSQKKSRRKPKLKIVIGITSMVFVLFTLSFLALRLGDELQRVEVLQSIAAGEEEAIVVFFHEDVSESETEIAQIVESLLVHPEVSEIVYVSWQETWDMFVEYTLSYNSTAQLPRNPPEQFIHTNNLRVYINRQEVSTFILLNRNNRLQRSINDLAEFAERIEGVRVVRLNEWRWQGF